MIFLIACQYVTESGFEKSEILYTGNQRELIAGIQINCTVLIYFRFTTWYRMLFQNNDHCFYFTRQNQSSDQKERFHKVYLLSRKYLDVFTEMACYGVSYFSRE